jgi:hypothetical protein
VASSARWSLGFPQPGPQGHDHAYARNFKLNAGRRVGDNEQGTVYMI